MQKFYRKMSTKTNASRWREKEGWAMRAKAQEGWPDVGGPFFCVFQLHCAFPESPRTLPEWGTESGEKATLFGNDVKGQAVSMRLPQERRKFLPFYGERPCC